MRFSDGVIGLLLLAAGAAVDARDWDGRTALGAAAISWCVNIRMQSALPHASSSRHVSWHDAPHWPHASFAALGVQPACRLRPCVEEKPNGLG